MIEMLISQAIKWGGGGYAKNDAVSETLLSINLHYFVYKVFRFNICVNLK